nr:MAG TPA: hypothetical protein [Caudoviricetes sp.]
MRTRGRAFYTTRIRGKIGRRESSFLKKLITI